MPGKEVTMRVSQEDKLLSGVPFKYAGGTYRYVPEFCIVGSKSELVLGGFVVEVDKYGGGELYYCSLEYHSRLGVHFRGNFFNKQIVVKVSYNHLKFLEYEVQS